MAVFVLVHGAWGGAHGFRKVRGPLREAGHEVFTPSLTGIGERAHLTSPQVCLTTHIADVVNAVWYEDLSDIVLLGYSYGGVVVTGALEHIGDRVRHLVYLDAFVPGDGETVASLGGATAGSGLAALGRDWLARRFPASTTTRPRRRGPDRGARRTRPAASPSRSGWRARWRTTRSPAPTSRPPANPGPRTAGRSGPPRTGPWPRRPGATGRSPPTT
jgi:Predicted hydrolases or acyltransferases (alpha/beta hydrolase superfamily)